METTYDWTYEYCDELKKIDPQYERFCMIMNELSVIRSFFLNHLDLRGHGRKN
ncbi:hypothetical protein H206_03081, partial [Candidatus Electrothrix aarhusensis]